MATVSVDVGHSLIRHLRTGWRCGALGRSQIHLHPDYYSLKKNYLKVVINSHGPCDKVVIDLLA